VNLPYKLVGLGLAGLAVRGMRVSFGGLRALDGVDLDIAPGEIVGVIGPNGAGKTTLLDCVSGFIPSAGRLWLGDRELTHLAPHERAEAGLGRSFQDARLFPTLTVVDAMLVSIHTRQFGAGPVAVLAGLPGPRRRAAADAARVDALIAQFGLGAFRHKLVRELSTGTRRIVDLACVVARQPRVVLLDEPSSGIAQRETEALGPFLHSIRDSTGCALVIVEHDMPLLLGIADRMYALETGTVVTSGAPGDVVRHPEVVRSYLGGDLTAINRSGAGTA
jgi:ABC-type branched-subunit amino acid transport system ATPase component